MKTLSTLVVLALILVPGTMLMAQASNATATVEADVQAALNLTKDVDISFGSVQATSNPDLDPTGVSHVDVGTSATVGEFSVDGSSGASVTVTYPATVTLNDGGANNMTFTPDVKGHVDGTQASATAIASASQIVLGASGYTVYIGGGLGALSGQAVGSYTAADGSGDFQLTVEYF